MEKVYMENTLMVGKKHVCLNYTPLHIICDSLKNRSDSYKIIIIIIFNLKDSTAN